VQKKPTMKSVKIRQDEKDRHQLFLKIFNGRHFDAFD
jgi:hypothetical protein